MSTVAGLASDCSVGMAQERAFLARLCTPGVVTGQTGGAQVLSQQTLIGPRVWVVTGRTIGSATGYMRKDG
jgi:hypothetical protein